MLMKTVKIAILFALSISFSNLITAQDLIDWGWKGATINQNTLEVEPQTPKSATTMDEADLLEAMQQAYIQEQKAKREEEQKKETPK